MEFLIGSPFATPVGQRVEQATSPNLQSEDWGLNMDICDIVNETEEGPKDAVRAIRKRIVGNKNFREVMLTLTVLEACVKNCGLRFHVLVSTREFVEAVLVKTILPKNNPPLALHDRVLSLIQAWADAFRSSPALTGVVSVYEDLRRKGLEFPMTELEPYSPIHTPQRSVPEHGPSLSVSAGPPSPQPSPVPPGEDGALTFPADQVQKLRADLQVVRGNLSIMSDMMRQLDPATVQHSDTELLQQLCGVCKDMQDRMVDLIPRLNEEKLTEELLLANDDINVTFARYERFKRVCNGQSVTQQSPTNANLIDLSPTTKPLDQSPVPATPAPATLSQSAVDAVPGQMAGLSLGGVDEFDTFVQKRSGLKIQQNQSQQPDGAAECPAQVLDSRQQNSGVEDSPDSSLLSSTPQFDWMVSKGMIPLTETTGMDDIEKWLDEDDDMIEVDGVTSEEFDKFLAERAKAGDRLPSVRASSHDATPTQPLLQGGHVTGDVRPH